MPTDRKMLHCRIATPLHERLTDTCDERAVGVGVIVERALERYLDALPPIEPHSSNGQQAATS